jgi:hypothetical protein
MPYGRGIAKAARILAALKRDGWIETRRSDGVDLGGPVMARIARDYGYTVDELRKL